MVFAVSSTTLLGGLKSDVVLLFEFSLSCWISYIDNFRLSRRLIILITCHSHYLVLNLPADVKKFCFIRINCRPNFITTVKSANDERYLIHNLHAVNLKTLEF